MKQTLLILALLISFTACSNQGPKTMKLIAGSGNASFTDGKSADMNKPIRFAPYTENSIIFADIKNHAIRIATIDGEVTTIVGGPHKAGYQDGPAKTAKLNSPHGVAYDKKKDIIYVAEASNHTIRVITKNAEGGFEVFTLAGNPARAGFMDGEVDSAMFSSPHAVNVSSDGGVVVADIGNARIRKIKDGMVSTIAGGSEEENEDETTLEASFKYVMDIVTDGESIYMADAGTHQIRKIIPGKEVTTLKLNNALNTPHGIAIDKKKNLYIADMGTNRILKIDPNGNVTAIAGTGKSGHDLLQLNKPAAVLVHGKYLWIADLNNHQIKAIEIE